MTFVVARVTAKVCKISLILKDTFAVATSATAVANDVYAAAGRKEDDDDDLIVEYDDNVNVDVDVKVVSLVIKDSKAVLDAAISIRAGSAGYCREDTLAGIGFKARSGSGTGTGGSAKNFDVVASCAVVFDVNIFVFSFVFDVSCS